MSDNTKYIVTLSTVPNAPQGEKIALDLVESKLAACVNIIPIIQSIYEWEGRIENDTESLLIIKSNEHVLNQLTEKLLEIHPYDCPEVISFDIRSGNPAYLEWIDKMVGGRFLGEEER